MFQADPKATLDAVRGWGLELNTGEILALTETDQILSDTFADEIDSRLQKASLKCR